MHTLSSGRAVLSILALAVALGACAGAGGGAGGGTSRSSSSSIQAEELQADAAMDLFTLIQRRRPRWLTNRAPSTAQGRQQISIILDGVRQQGSAEILRSMRSGDVESVEYMNAGDATTRFGTDMTAGAIIVKTKR